MKFIAFTLVLLLVFACTAWPQDTQGSSATHGAQETITVPKSEMDELKARLDKLEQEVQQLKDNKPTAQPEEQAEVTEPGPAPEAPAPEPESNPSAGGKHLALPDISLIGQAKGYWSSDKNDPARNRVRLSELELGIQGWVYPQVKADAFITMSPQENSPAQVEEAYLTYLGLTKGLNFYVGEKHVAFGRTNLLHNHSWLYVNQPLVLRNLVAVESLTGEGLSASYLLPTGKNLFAQLDLGTWTGSQPGESTVLPDVMVGPGAGFSDRFNTARLWTGYSLSPTSELEAGGSYAQGEASDTIIPTGQVRLTGADLTYRHFGEGDSRLLVRGEQIWRRELGGDFNGLSQGYYGFCNWRWDKYNSLGALYSWSGLPQANGLHESQASLILTKQFSEQYYVRLQYNQGARPDDEHYREIWLQWVWGVGPHTHNLE